MEETMTRQQFEVILEKPDDVIVTYITVPFSVEEVFSTRSQVKVKGTVDGAAYRSSIQPTDGRRYAHHDRY
jgi:hypothetical protein